MGYDMSLVETPPELVAAKEAYSNWWKSYDKGNRDFDTLPSDPTYFRLNIFGMGTYRIFMSQFHMLAENYEMPKFKNNKQWEKVIDSPLAGEEPGIPVDKLCSNDGWLVRPEECASAIKQYERFSRDIVKIHVGEDNLEYWDKWIAFIRLAANHGGFRVY